MCLYVDDDEWELLAEGSRRARKEHQCFECTRLIEAGEPYRFWTGKEYGGDSVETRKMCAHCWGTIELGSRLTGCPKSWYWDQLHSLDEEMGFVGNIIHDPGHDLTDEQIAQMMQTVEGREKKWREDGQLLPVPA